VIELTLSFVAILLLFAIVEWRLGLLLAVVTAVLQDPLRKIAPDQPVWFVVLVGIVFAGACLGAWFRGVPLTPNRVFRDQQLAITLWVLLLLVIFQAVNSYLRFGNPMISLTGLLTYLLPLPSIVFAYQLALREGEARVNQFMKAYVLLTIVALTTVYLEYAGYDWPVLGQVGSAVWFHDKSTGALIVPHSGIFRAYEIAAWHAMACACFVVLLATLQKIDFRSVAVAAVALAFLVGIGVLTGRRKLLMEVVVFAGTYFILWAIFQKRMAKLGIILAIAGLVGYGWLVAQVNDGQYIGSRSLAYSLYVDRAKTVFEDAPSRFVELGIAPIMWAYESFGFFGAGLGVGTQGTQHFGGGGAIAGGAIAGATEGGLGKIAVELGIPGLFLMGWLGISLCTHLWRIMRASSQISPRIGRLSFGLFSFLVANLAAFSVATQAFGDLFILLVLSWTLGFFLAVPALLGREVRRRQAAGIGERAPILRPKIV
jgi:hypothetical protein